MRFCKQVPTDLHPISLAENDLETRAASLKSYAKNWTWNLSGAKDSEASCRIFRCMAHEVQKWGGSVLILYKYNAEFLTANVITLNEILNA